MYLCYTHGTKGSTAIINITNIMLNMLLSMNTPNKPNSQQHKRSMSSSGRGVSRCRLAHPQHEQAHPASWKSSSFATWASESDTLTCVKHIRLTLSHIYIYIIHIQMYMYINMKQNIVCGSFYVGSPVLAHTQISLVCLSKQSRTERKAVLLTLTWS